MKTLGILLLANPEGEGGGMQTILMLGLILVVFYFFMIRPQQKKQKTEKKFRESLAKGNRVVTIGGIHGKVAEVKDDTVLIHIEDGSKMRVEKSAISPTSSPSIQEQPSAAK